jgi:hypothetical protein
VKVHHHAAASTAIGGALYAATASPWAAVACILGGVLIDVDHLLDFFIQARQRFTPAVFFRWSYSSCCEKYFLPFHSYELLALVAVLAVLYPHPAVVGLAAGIGAHMAMDQYGNRMVGPSLRMRQGFYFLSWRALLGFRKDKLLFEGF